ncbi:MAG: hypothetical protein NZ853_07005 [Leptospiraceae bacterium]|nr:hypothetical protein [Leptospiraceae bacterium]MDW7975818.1 hypothetical protein [Leptospiraceae bacterium]
MKEVLDAVEEDKQAGLHKDIDGRLYFVPRKVKFKTIEFKEEYIFSHSWGIFQEPLVPIDWKSNEHDLDKKVINFSKECSLRFHHLWYRYIDIMIARSLSLNDKNIFIKDFIKPSIFLDLGVPENPEWSNVPYNIQQKIIQEYRISLKYERRKRIFYLSEYLQDLTKDLIDYLSPYEPFWKLQEEKLKQYENLRESIQELHKLQFFQFLKGTLNEFLRTKLINANVLIQNKMIANIQYQLMQTKNYILGYFERKAIIEFLIKNQLIDSKYKILYILNEYTQFPNEVERFMRKIYYLEAQINKEKLKRLKKIYNESRNSPKDFVFLEKEKVLEFATTSREEELIQEKINTIYKLTEFLDLLHNQLIEFFIQKHQENQIRALDDFFKFFSSVKEEVFNNSYEVSPLKRKILDQIREFSKINSEIYQFYKNNLFNEVKLFIPNPKYRNHYEIPNHFTVGNPFQEREILDFCKKIIQERLKPIRMASNDYSLLHTEKHGILTLNPVLKLWKNQIQIQKDLPEIIQLELNTPIVVECLLELAQLVDKDLPSREIRRGAIIKQARGVENLENLYIMIIPGSCYPIKEIPSSHFPEFQNKIIGEKRSFSEVGVDETHYILTGAWYNKDKHTLYYPIGGDNAELLKRIYLGIRENVVPAFFFALGQFVFECLSEDVLYYRTTKKTFREILLKIYQSQDLKESELKRVRLFSREEIKFQFAIYYSQLIMENLTGGLHIHKKIPELYKWFFENLSIQSIFSLDREHRREIRLQAQNIIYKYNEKWLELINQKSN